MQRSKQFMRVGSSTIRWKRGYHQQISKQPIQQELTESLKDSFGRKHNYLRISLSERCNLRCQYCMPEEGVTLTPPNHLMSTSELLRIANLFISEGVDKIRLTGGEPLVRKDIIQICKELKSNKQLKTLGITTNGVTLKRHLATLKEVGVTHLNISLDTLQPQKFEFITRRKGWSKVLDSIEASLLHGFDAVKLNCVVMKGLNEDELVDFVKFTEDKNIEVRFIEYMPFDGNKWSVNKFYPYQAMLDKIKVVYPELQRLSDAPNDTSKAYQVKGFKGRIGFITSMSENFCSSCNRLRITSDGKLKVCLFGPKEVSLIDAIRCGMSDEDLLEIISSAVHNKKKQHAGMMNISKTKNRPMILVGGLMLHSTLVSKNISSSLLFSTSKQRFSTHEFSHVDGHGKIKMVDIASKQPTSRTAKASCNVFIGENVYNAIKQNSISKGDVLTVSKIAGIMGGKKTSDLIPLCHNIQLESIDIQLKLNDDNESITITSAVQCLGKTGVEMEALTAVTVAALTLYDMCKSLSHKIRIDNVKLISKTGGKTDFCNK